MTEVTLVERVARRIRRGGRYMVRGASLIKSALYDYRRFARFSSFLLYEDDEEKLRALITAAYHNIEKGLSLPSPRLGFGAQNIAKLTRLIDECLLRYGPRPYLIVPISVIGAYVAYHESRGHSVEQVKSEWARLSASNKVFSPESSGGVILALRSDVEAATLPVSQEFFDLRFSCRQYADAPVTEAQIRLAVAAAQKSPVVCNRQSGRVWAYTHSGEIQRILAVQGGARGFSENVKALFCITVDLRNFHGVGERYQGWIDGGLFAMSFIFGLHRQSIGSCCLNWSKNDKQDREMRDLLNLPPHEMIIMFVAAGHLPEQFEVARSNRKNMDEVLTFGRLVSDSS